MYTHQNKLIVRKKKKFFSIQLTRSLTGKVEKDDETRDFHQAIESFYLRSFAKDTYRIIKCTLGSSKSNKRNVLFVCNKADDRATFYKRAFSRTFLFYVTNFIFIYFFCSISRSFSYTHIHSSLKKCTSDDKKKKKIECYRKMHHANVSHRSIHGIRDKQVAIYESKRWIVNKSRVWKAEMIPLSINSSLTRERERAIVCVAFLQHEKRHQYHRIN